MSSRTQTVLAGSLGLLLASAVMSAQVDEPQLAVLDEYETPYRWENVEGAPVWLEGQTPHRVWRSGLHVIELEPGEFATVRLPAGGVLRAYRLDDVWRPDEVQFFRSDGQGLWAEGDPVRSKDGRSLVDVDDRGRHQAQLVRVERSSEQPGPIRFALFVGRYHTFGAIVPERERIEGPEEGISIRRPQRRDEDRFWPLATNQAWTVEIEGPKILELQSRFRYPATEARAQQSYLIRATLDDAYERWIDHYTGAENGRMLVGEKEEPVGRLRLGYLHVPEGRHVLKIEASAPLYVQLLARRRHDFLLSGLNEPKWDWTRTLDNTPWKPRPNSSKPEPAEVSRADAVRTIEDGATLAKQMQVAHDAARNNRYRGGGLLGWRLAATEAARRPDAPRLASYADELRAFHTFYRPLLPETETRGAGQSYSRFLGRSLANLGESHREIFVAEQHLPDSIRNVGAGYFHAVPERQRDASVYFVPRQSAPSILRLAVDLDSGASETHLWVQLAHHRPRHLRVTPAAALSSTELRAPQPLGGLAVLDRREPYVAEVTLAGPISRWSTPAPLRRVATAELALPAGVEEIRVWSNQSSTLRVALDYRTARPYALSETAYRSMTRRAGGSASVATLFHELVVNGSDPPPNATYEVKELASHLEPAARLLRNRIRGFETPVRPRHQPDLDTIDDGWSGSIAETAALYEAEAQPLLALEAWSRTTHAMSLDLRLDAFRGQLRTLQSLGESFLRGQLLRATYLFSPEQDIRDAALDHLLDSAEGEAELFTLRVLEWRRSPNVENLRALILASLPIGEYEMALVLGLMIDPAERPVRELLRAAYQLDWWTVYEELACQLDETERGFWSGHRALKFGRVDEALQQFQHAGRAGEEIVSAVHTGRDISHRLRDGDRTAVLAWERWQAGHPGPRTWSEAAPLINDFAGTTQVYNIGRDLYSRFYRATPTRPVSLRVLGPVRLRLETRPLLPSNDGEPVDDWLFIRKPGRLQVEPINANRPTAELRLIGPETGTTLGRSVATEFDVEPGLHEIEIYGGTLELLIRVFAERPEMPVGILPALTPETLRAALTGDVLVASPVRGQPIVAPPATAPALTVCTLPSGHEASDCFEYRAVTRRELESRRADTEPDRVDLDPVTALRVRLRTGELLGDDFDYRRLTRPLRGMSASEQILAVGRWRQHSPGFDPGLMYMRDGPGADRREAHLASGDIEAALRLPQAGTDEALLQRLNILLYWAELFPEHRADAVRQGQRLLEGRARPGRLQSSYVRLVRGMRWQSLASLDRSAGLVRRESRGWSPEAPTLRVRRALLPNVHTGHRAVVGVEPLHFFFSNLEPVDLKLDLSVTELDFLRGHSLRMFYQLDDEPPVGLVLDRQEPQRTLSFTMAAGRHALRVWNGAPFTNQYLLVSAQVSREVLKPAGNRDDVIGTNRIERAYHVATPDEAVVARILGPTVLRIHELDAGHTRVRYRHVEEGWQTIELYPRPGRSEGLFRLFESVYAPDRPNSRTPYIAAEPTPVPPALVELGGAPSVTPLGVVDRLPLGGQEDGTWSTTTRVTQPSDVDDIAEGGNENDRYLEVRATHRRLHEATRTHTSWSGLFRVRPTGGETIGFRGLYRREPERVPFSVTVEGGTYGQRLESDTAWSMFGRASLSDYRRLGLRSAHMSRASLTARHLTLDRRQFEDFQSVDQDVFTTYKDDHRARLQFSDTFFFFPWLDTEWWVGGTLATNARLNPLDLDNVELRGGWRQLLGDLHLSADYRHRRYLADQNRSRSLTRRALTLSGEWEPWFTSRNGLEMGLWLRRDFDTRDTRASVYITWHRSNGRGYRDFRPRETNFQQRRHLRLHRRTLQ